MSRTCDGCSVMKSDSDTPWWGFSRYNGPHLAASPTHPLAISGFFCPACSSKIMGSEASFNEFAVPRLVTKRLKA